MLIGKPSKSDENLYSRSPASLAKIVNFTFKERSSLKKPGEDTLNSRGKKMTAWGDA